MRNFLIGEALKYTHIDEIAKHNFKAREKWKQCPMSFYGKDKFWSSLKQ